MHHPSAESHRQMELLQRKLGMRSLNPVQIARHFAQAAEHRRLAQPSLVLLDASGTKGATSAI